MTALDFPIGFRLMGSVSLVQLVLVFNGVNELRGVIGIDEVNIVLGAFEVAKSPLYLPRVFLDAGVQRQELRLFVSHE